MSVGRNTDGDRTKKSVKTEDTFEINFIHPSIDNICVPCFVCLIPTPKSLPVPFKIQNSIKPQETKYNRVHVSK